MLKKFSNKTLIIVLAVLVILLLVNKFFFSAKHEKTFKTELFGFDTSAITAISLYPKAEQGQEIRFSKESDGKWMVAKDNKKAEADLSAVDKIVNGLLQIKPERLAAKKKDKWRDFEVTDSLGTRIKLYAGKNEVADVYIGKFGVQQRNDMPQGMNFNQQNNIRGISYVRLADEDEVYAVEGFLTMTFNQGYNSWRNRTVTKLNSDNITKVVFSYPADTGFVLENIDSTWLVSGVPVDENKVKSYLKTLSNQSNSNFADDFVAARQPILKISIEGNNMAPVSIECYPGNTENNFILHSSQNPAVYFSSDASGLYKNVFKGKSEFLMQ